MMESRTDTTVFAEEAPGLAIKRVKWSFKVSPLIGIDKFL
jgi:hypothetical protein